MPLLSVVIPVFNEENTIASLIREVQQVDVASLGVQMEIVAVDDCSTDGTWRALEQIAVDEKIRVFRHERNRGKGAALHTGFAHVQGDIVVVQDADHEYDPNDYLLLLAPILEGRADVVYGSRYLTRSPMPALRFWHTVGNKILTMLSNMFTNLYLTDAHTCYKMFRRSILDGMTLRENRFAFDPEFTAKVARKLRGTGGNLSEVAISYQGRSHSEGKKIGWKDAVSAVYAVAKYNLLA